MQQESHFSWKARLKSFRFAAHGLRLLLNEHNARIHISVALLVVATGFLLHISLQEWIAVVVCIAVVITAEAFNSALEVLADRITCEIDPLIGRAKDLAAGAVLIVAIGAVIVGLLIFIPKIISLFS